MLCVHAEKVLAWQRWFYAACDNHGCRAKISSCVYNDVIAGFFLAWLHILRPWPLLLVRLATKMLAGSWTTLVASVALLPSLSAAFPSSHELELESWSLFSRDYIQPDVDSSKAYPFSPSLKPDASRWPKGLHFAVDYYPAQWPDLLWADDAARMANATLSYARISEFDWAILEPTDGNYDWSLLDRSIQVLHQQGVKVILGTPTATPPVWAVKNYDILGADAQGRQRRFGSRRHYSFSSTDYRMLLKRFVAAMAKRYGSHEAVVGWQIDNELGCHGTVRTYDNNARKRWQQWLSNKYNNNITLYNMMQGRVFWSSTYQSFDQIELPMLEVTESSPAGRLDFYHFSSDMAIEYAKEQVDMIRKYSDKAITTNFMGAFLDFDHFKLARETGIDLVTWDSYPLGNTEQFSWISDADKIKYGRTGTPDFQAFHHDLYRGVAGAAYNKTAGPFGIMEQQPGESTPKQCGSRLTDVLRMCARFKAFASFAHQISICQSQCVHTDYDLADRVLKSLRTSQLGRIQSVSEARNGTALAARDFCSRRKHVQHFPMASGSVCSRADARCHASTRQCC